MTRNIFRELLEADILKRHAQGSQVAYIGLTEKQPSDASLPDCVIALNALKPESRWQDALRQWQQMTRPDGLIIFNAHSHEHIAAAASDLDTAGGSPGQVHIDTQELLTFADHAGFTVTAIIPYGAFLGEPDSNWFLYPELESKRKWNRLLSWFERDQALFDFGLFLEQSLIAHLTPRVCGRMFVVLKNKAAATENQALRDDMAARNAALAQHDFKALLPWLPLAQEQYATELNQHLRPLRNRVFFYWLYRSLMMRLPQFNLRGVIEPDIMAQYALWQKHEKTDAQALDIVRHWAKDADFRFKDGIDVTIWSQYNMIKTVLADYFGVFNHKEAR